MGHNYANFYQIWSNFILDQQRMVMWRVPPLLDGPRLVDLVQPLLDELGLSILIPQHLCVDCLHVNDRDLGELEETTGERAEMGEWVFKDLNWVWRLKWGAE